MKSFGFVLLWGFPLHSTALRFSSSFSMQRAVGQDSWPLLGNIGDDTPAEIRAIFDQSNIGFEQEELPCVEF